MNWKKTVTSVVITTSLMTSGYAASETNGSTMAAPASIAYNLNENLSVEINSVLNERVQTGTRIGVVVRMKNNGSAVARVPEYEVRVKTSEGVEYILQPSTSNPKSIQPKANTDLSYLTVIDRTDAVTLSEVNWTDVDYYVYPKKETLIVGVPIAEQTWKGSDMPITDPAAIKKWGETFRIPTLLSPLQYTPVSISKEVTDKGTVQVVQFLVKNPAGQREIVPNITVDGKTDKQADTAITADLSAASASQVKQSFSGKKVEQGEVVIEANDQKYIHFAIETDNDTVLTGINVLTPEQFTQAGAQGAQPATINYNVGRLKVLVPGTDTPSVYPAYQLGAAMSFDSLSELIHPNLEVSMVEFNMSDNLEEGTKNVTSKFKLFNKSDKPLTVPAFQTDLLSADGYTYSGNRQNITTQRILPNSGIVVSYSYTLPNSEAGIGLSLKVNDTKEAAPYKTTIAAYSVELQKQQNNTEFTVYPFTAKITDWTISPIFNLTGTLKYSYKAKFFFDLKRIEQIQVDSSFSKLHFEIYNSVNNLIGTTPVSFIGAGRLTSGENNIIFDAKSDQLDRPLSIKLYEVFTTPAGDSKRLLAVFKE